MESPSFTYDHKNHLDQWLTVVTDMCGDFSIKMNDTDKKFVGEIDSENIGGLELARVSCNADSVNHGRANGDRGEDSHCFLIFQYGSETKVQNGAVSQTLRPGEIFLLDPIHRIEMNPKGTLSQYSIPLAREDVAKGLSGGKSCAGKIVLDGVCGQMLKTLVRQLISGDVAKTASEAEGRALHSSLVELSRVAILAAPEAANSNDALGVMRRAGRARAEELIAISLQDRALTPQSLADALNISVRQLYRLFEDEDYGLHQYILSARLSKCASDLARFDSNKTVTDISYSWGFSDSAHFSRVFKAHFGQSPREYRLAHAVK